MVGALPREEIPGQARCREILEQCQVPQHIRRHSEVVARVADLLAGQLAPLQGGEPSPDAVRAAALLHDIAKMPCLQSHTDHALEGAQQLRAMGYQRIAEMVGRHVRLGQWDPGGPVSGAEILNYSDKRVRHEEVVDLDARFADLLQRYGRGRPEVERRIVADRQVIEALERKIFSRLPYGPEEVASRLAGAAG